MSVCLSVRLWGKREIGNFDTKKFVRGLYPGLIFSMNIPLIYKQIFYKYFDCLFDGCVIKDIMVFKNYSS